MLVSNILLYQYFLIMHFPFRANSAVMTANQVAFLSGLNTHSTKHLSTTSIIFLL